MPAGDWGDTMLRTIQVGTCVSVQGLVLRHLDDGRVVIRVGDRTYAGAAARCGSEPRAMIQRPAASGGLTAVQGRGSCGNDNGPPQGPVRGSVHRVARSGQSVRSTVSRSKISMTSFSRMSS